MKNRLHTFRIAAVICASLAAPAAMAETTPMWEINGGALSQLNFASAGDTSTTTFSINASAGYWLGNGFQLSMGFALQTSSGATAFVPTVGATYNFGGTKLQDDFFVSPQVGLSVVSISDASSTNLMYGVVAGKRFQINESIAYVPSIAFVGVTSDPSATTFAITPLSFSLFL